MAATPADLLATSPDDAPEALAALVHDALGVRIDGAVEVTAVDYVHDAPATGGLYRIAGRTETGEGWSVFCKVLQHVRHWPQLALLPAELRDALVEQLPWRSELQLWDADQLATFPVGLRAPRLFRLVDLGDDRLAAWQEEVPHERNGWDLDRFARAGRLLGRWNARSTTPRALAVLGGFPPGYALRMYVENAVIHRGLRVLADDELWSHPQLAGHGDLRHDLLGLGARIPELLDSLDAMVQCAPHGDACPQNLLCALDSPDTLVVIDLSFRSSHALGFDLGQLLVGLVHAGARRASTLPETAQLIAREYVAGLEDEGISGRADAAARGFATSALLRSGFDSFRYDLIGDPSEAARRTFAERVELARFLLDQYRTIVG